MVVVVVVVTIVVSNTYFSLSLSLPAIITTTVLAVAEEGSFFPPSTYQCGVTD